MTLKKENNREKSTQPKPVSLREEKKKGKIDTLLHRLTKKREGTDYQCQKLKNRLQPSWILVIQLQYLTLDFSVASCIISFFFGGGERLREVNYLKETMLKRARNYLMWNINQIWSFAAIVIIREREKNQKDIVITVLQS